MKKIIVTMKTGNDIVVSGKNVDYMQTLNHLELYKNGKIVYRIGKKSIAGVKMN